MVDTIIIKLSRTDYLKFGLKSQDKFFRGDPFEEFTIRLNDFLSAGKIRVSWEEKVNLIEAQGFISLGDYFLDKLLSKEYKHIIPELWKEQEMICFDGIISTHGQDRRVGGMFWDRQTEKWYRTYRELVYGFYSNHPSVVIKKRVA